jgi:hypothetical protein
MGGDIVLAKRGKREACFTKKAIELLPGWTYKGRADVSFVLAPCFAN